MKHLLPLLFCLSSCSLTEEQKATLASNLEKDAAAAINGGLSTGTWQGAGLAAAGQVARNHLTSAKQPQPVLP